MISASNELLKNYSNGALPPLAGDASNKIAVLFDFNQTEFSNIAAVNHDNNVLYFSYDKQTVTGWNSEVIKVPGAPKADIKELMGFYVNKIPHIVVHYPNGSGENLVKLMSKIDGNWKEVEFSNPNMKNALNNMSQTDVTYDKKTNNALFYGVSSSFTPNAFVFAGLDETTNKFNLYYEEFLDNPKATYGVAPGNGDSQYSIIKFEDKKITVRNGSIVDGKLKLLDKVHTQQLDVSVDADKFISLNTSEEFLVLSSDGKLVLVSDIYNTAKTQVLSGGEGEAQKISEASVVFDNKTESWNVFAIESESTNLWLLREETSDGGISFSPWVNLGNRVHAIGTPRMSVFGAEVFLYDLGNNLLRLGENPNDHTWKSSHILSPVEDSPIVENSTFIGEVTFRDEMVRLKHRNPYQ